MSAHLVTHTRHTLYWLIRGVLLESIRRRETSVVLLFMGLFLVGSVVVRIVGVESAAAASFILNLGLSLAWILAMIVAIIMAARQFPDEQESRSLYPLLAKPVSRSAYVLGKWLATLLVGVGTALLLDGIALLASPWPAGTSPLLLVQVLILQGAAIGAATAIAFLLSLIFSKALTMVVTGLWVFGGNALLAFVRNRAAFARGDGSGGFSWLFSYLPDFGRWDFINALTAGEPPLTLLDFASRLLLAALFAFLMLSSAMVLLERKPL